MQKFVEHLNNEVLKHTCYQGTISVQQDALYFRYDTGLDDVQDSEELYYSIQEDFKEIGITITNAQVEHDCISGDIELLDSRYVKQIIVMRKDLKMRRGKEIAQGSHASLAVVYKIENEDKQPLYYRNWKERSFTKICLTVNSEEELLKVYNDCKLNDIPSVLITDIGRTEFNGIPTNTCIGIGPFWNCEINKVTSHLKLY